MNQLYDINRPLFKLVVAMALLDLAWGFGILFLPDAEIVRTQSYVITSLGKDVLGTAFIAKGVAMLLILIKTSRFDTLRWFMSFGVLFWTVLAVIMLIGLLHGFRATVFGVTLLFFMAYMRYLVVRLTPEERRARR